MFRSGSPIESQRWRSNSWRRKSSDGGSNEIFLLGVPLHTRGSGNCGPRLTPHTPGNHSQACCRSAHQLNYLLFSLIYWNLLFYWNESRESFEVKMENSLGHFCPALAVSYLGAHHHFWVKTRFGILVESSFIWANQVWPRAILAPKNDRNKKCSD